jgi:hypothetical protein
LVKPAAVVVLPAPPLPWNAILISNCLDDFQAHFFT